jgi:hypothetical protein
MANVTVWLFDNPYSGTGAVGAGVRRYATHAAIEREGLIPLAESAIELDELFVNADGYTRSEYLTFRIRVLHDHAYAGYARDRVRLQLMAGEYDARLALREFVAAVGAERCLQVIGADQRPHGGNLWVKLSEYQYELERFPDDVPEQRMTVIDRRITAAHELNGA